MSNEQGNGGAVLAVKPRPTTPRLGVTPVPTPRASVRGTSDNSEMSLNKQDQYFSKQRERSNLPTMSFSQQAANHRTPSPMLPLKKLENGNRDHNHHNHLDFNNRYENDENEKDEPMSAMTTPRRSARQQRRLSALGLNNGDSNHDDFRHGGGASRRNSPTPPHPSSLTSHSLMFMDTNRALTSPPQPQPHRRHLNSPPINNFR
jgi:hypothetical protein